MNRYNKDNNFYIYLYTYRCCYNLPSKILVNYGDVGTIVGLYKTSKEAMNISEKLINLVWSEIQLLKPVSEEEISLTMKEDLNNGIIKRWSIDDKGYMKEKFVIIVGDIAISHKNKKATFPGIPNWENVLLEDLLKRYKNNLVNETEIDELLVLRDILDNE